jgi:hypothetical protein
MIRVTLCTECGLKLIAAARGCGSTDEQEQIGFLCDMLESTLYEPVRALAGEAAGDICVCCAYAFPEEAIDDAVVGALALRKQYGVRPRLN